MDNDVVLMLKGYVLPTIIISLIILICLFGISCEPIFAQEIDTTKAVIHHTASPDWSVHRIRKIHVEENGWSDIGYHFVIRKNGDIETGRSINKKGAHALTGKSYSRNHYVGIALTGNDTFIKEQIVSLKKLLKKLGVKHIERHHEKCPGKGLDIEKIQEEL